MSRAPMATRNSDRRPSWVTVALASLGKAVAVTFVCVSALMYTFVSMASTWHEFLDTVQSVLHLLIQLFGA